MMRSIRNRALPAALVLGAMTLAACSSSPEPETFGSRVATEGNAVAEIGEQWNKGEAMILKGQKLREDGKDDVKDGERLVSKGEDKISDGRRDIRRGESMIADGERLKAQAEESYRLRQLATVPQT